MGKIDDVTNYIKSYPKTVTFLLHVTFWAAFFSLPFLLSDGSPFDPETLKQDIHLMEDIQGKPFFFLLQIGGLLLAFYVNAFVLAPRYFTQSKYLRYILSVLVLVNVLAMLNIILGKWLFQVSGSISFPQRFRVFPIILGVLLGLIFHLAKAYILKEKQVQSQQSEQLQTELKFLRSQVNPHFLFNVLNSLVSLARKKSDELEPSLIKLSQLLQFMLYDSDQEIISLTDEVEYLNSYIDLQRLRFGQTVPIAFTVTAQNDLAVTIAPMLLIPLVENAFKHGIGLIKSPHISIRLNYENGQLAFEVENAFADHDTKDGGSGIGLNNLQRRLELLYPGKFEFNTRVDDHLFTATLKIDLQ
jgi:two-component system LytT family sensor kinase